MSAAVSLDPWLNRVHEGEALSVMAALPDESIDLVLCDPPYGITDCAWDAEIPFEALWTELRRILKPRAAAVLCASGRFTSRLIESTKSSLPCRYRWFWDRGRTSNIMNAHKMPLRQVEELVVLSKKSAKYHPQMVPSAPHTVGRHIQSTVWGDTFKRPKADRGEFLNPWYNRRHISVGREQPYGGVMYTPELPGYLAARFAEYMPLYRFLQEVWNNVLIERAGR